MSTNGRPHLDRRELEIVLEAQALVELGLARWVDAVPHTAGLWECPCGREEPRPGATTTPVRTLVSLRELWCPFCGRTHSQRIEGEAGVVRASAAHRIRSYRAGKRSRPSR